MPEQQTTPDQSHLPDKVPVTCYPVGTLKQFERMRDRVARKPYAKHFHEDLYVYSDIIPAIRKPLAPEQVLPLRDASRLLDPGYLEGENGWCALRDGTAYVSSKTRFPGVTGDMIDWWFWWHSVEDERYALWYPYNHAAVRSSFAGGRRPLLHRADLGHREKWLGSTHRVAEFIGPYHKTIRIQFVEPHRHHCGGLAPGALEGAGYVAAVCAVLWDAYLPLKLGEFVHLWREVEGGGLELRSRYWLGHQVHLQLLGLKIPLDYLGGLLGIKRMLAGEGIAYEQFLHDQIEFTNLARILPGLYSEFGPGSSPK